MTPEPDASASPPEPASVPASTPAAPSAPERRAVEALVAGAAGLILGRVLLGRAGGLATGLAAFGAGLLGKCPPPAPPSRPEDGAAPEAEGSQGHAGSNGHTPPAAAPSRHSAPVSLSPGDVVPMRVRLETSPVPPVDAAAALTRAELSGSTLFAPITAQALVPPAPLTPPESVMFPPPAVELEPEPGPTAGTGEEEAAALAPSGPDAAVQAAAEALSLAAAAAETAAAGAGFAAAEAAFAAGAGAELSIEEIFGVAAEPAEKAKAAAAEEPAAVVLEHPEAAALAALPEAETEPAPEAPAVAEAPVTPAMEWEDAFAASFAAPVAEPELPAESEPEPEPEPELELELELVAETAAVAVPETPGEDPEDAGAFAEIPALFAPPEEVPAEPAEPEVSFRTPPPVSAIPGIEPLPLTALLEQAETELETPPPPDAAAPVAARPVTAPVMPLDAVAETAAELPAAVQVPRLASAPVPVAVTEAAVGTLAEAVARVAAAATAPVPAVAGATSPVSLPPTVPTGRTAPVPGLLEELPVEFAELKAEEEPGPRGDFLLVPEETPQSLPPLAPVVAALNVPLTAPAAAAPPAFPSVSAEVSAEPVVVAVPATSPVPVPWPTMEEEPLAEGEISPEIFADAVRESTSPVPPVSENPFAAVPVPATAPVSEAAPAMLSGALIPDPGWSAEVSPAPAAHNLPVSWAGAASVTREPTAPVPIFQEMAPPPAVAVEAPVPRTSATPPPWGLPEVPAQEPVAADSALDDVPPFPAAPSFVTLAAAIARPPTSPVAPILLPPPPATAPVPPVPATAPVEPVEPVEPVIPVALETPAPAAPVAVVPPVPVIPEVAPESALPFPAAPAAAPWTIDPAGAPVVPPPPPETFAVPLGPVPPTPPPARHTTGPFPGESASSLESSPSSFILHRSAEPATPVYTPPYPIPMAAPVSPPPGSGSPEEIWRQAVAELSAFRSQAVPGAPAFPPPVGAPGGMPNAFPAVAGPPVLPAQPPPVESPAVPAQLPVPATGPAPAAVPAELPPWLKSAPAPEPAAETAEEATDAGNTPAKPFLPTIRLSVPQGPRRPVPLSTPPLTTAAVRPSPLPGYRVESLTGSVPSSEAAPESAAPATAPVTPAIPEIPALPVPEAPVMAPVAVETPPAATLGGILSSLPAVAPASQPVPGPALPPMPQPAAGSPPSAAVPAVPIPGDKLYVDRQKSSSRSGGGKVPAHYRKSTLTPARVVAVIVLALAALALAYKDSLIPWFRRIWEQRILGRLPVEKGDPEAKPPVPPAEGADVKVVPDSKPPAGAGAKPGKPAPPPVKPVTPPAATTQPAAHPMPDTEPLPPPPAAAPAIAEGPIPATEAGAKDLITRLLYATTTAQVSPWILESARISPGLESYFASGKQVPVSSHVCTLTHTEKNPATNRSTWEFKVVTDTVEGGFPVLVEETKDGLRLNWELLSQCRDLQFQKWAADTTAPAARFYLGLERRHPFADMLPGQDHTRFMAFAVSPPILGEPSVFVFIPVNSPLAARAGKLFPFTSGNQAPFAPVLELEHRNGHIEITGIVKENWRAVEPAKK